LDNLEFMVEIKICGIKREKDLKTIIDLNVSWAGFVFYNKSVRAINRNDQIKLFKTAKNKIGIVALFVNPEDTLIEEVTTLIKPDLIQLHGSETPDRCKDIKFKTGIPVMKAIQLNNIENLKTVSAYENKVDRLLFDAKLTEAKLRGISTKPFEWQIVKHYEGKKEWMLAGGLNSNNIENAIKESGAKAVDVSGGVEISPGIKSKKLIKKFIGCANEINL